MISLVVIVNLLLFVLIVPVRYPNLFNSENSPKLIEAHKRYTTPLIQEAQTNELEKDNFALARVPTVPNADGQHADEIDLFLIGIALWISISIGVTVNYTIDKFKCKTDSYHPMDDLRNTMGESGTDRAVAELGGGFHYLAEMVNVLMADLAEERANRLQEKEEIIKMFRKFAINQGEHLQQLASRITKMEKEFEKIPATMTIDHCSSPSQPRTLPKCQCNPSKRVFDGTMER